MRQRSRRNFIGAIAAVTACGGIGGIARAVHAAMGPNDKFDLVIKGGEVLDPSQGCGRGATSASATAWSKRSRPIFPPSARCACSMPAARIVTPGLIDLHAHVYPYGSAIGIPADELVPFQDDDDGVSAGDAGANNFAAFRRHIVAQTRTRLYAFVHIANIGLAGFPVPELYNIGYADVPSRRRERSPRTRTSSSASRCACRRTSSRSTASSR